MSPTVIVALPPVDDRVNKVSSEKVAHLTMLFLGDVQLSAEAVLYVQHACSELSPFGLSVDYRDKLGEDEADVLFFEKNAWDIERIADFRHWLLLNDEIKRAYDSVEQFPEWQPHLTLGYPATPAVEDDEDRRFHYVDFDRIAVWSGDFEGPEFRLKYDDHSMDVAMSAGDKGALYAAAILAGDENALKQYGKKGMKWGVRNDNGHQGEQVKTKKLEKLDKKWEADMNRNAYMKMYNAAADKMNNGGIDAINNKPEYKNVDLSKPGPLRDKYDAEHETAMHNAMVEAGPSLGMNPSGTKQFVIKRVSNPDGEDYDDVFLEPVGLDLKHADVDVKVVAFRLNQDETGHTSSMEQVELELKHYGVKGMKWGVTTKDRAKQTTPAPVTVTQKAPGKYAKSKGGQRNPMTEDAKKSLEARQKAKASTTDALSNKELQEAVNRMQLEQRYKQLEFQSDRRSRGAKFIAGLFGAKRYDGKDIKFKDSSEEQGAAVRDAIKKVVDEKAKATTS